MSDAAFTAEFADLKIIKSRKTVVICLEVPLEQADHALKVLGGVPNPAESRYVAVARLETQPAKVEKPAGKTPSQRAWALCQSPRFAQWWGSDLTGAEQVAEAMRGYLGIKSRGDLDRDPEARARFENLEREYQEASR